MKNHHSQDGIQNRARSVFGIGGSSLPINLFLLGNQDFTTVIREASLFERVSENEMISQPLSDDTILMDDIVYSTKYR